VFVDEAGFYLLPAAVATYAPVGQTPVLREMLTRDHLSAISAVTPDGRLRIQVSEEAISGAEVVRFLEHLARTLPGGKFTILWDGAPIHHGRAVQQFLAQAPAGRFEVEQLPGYAPDLNPDEGVWDHVKDDDLANVSCLDLRGLRVEIRGAARRLQRRPDLVRGFFRQAGYG
jgi:transposase